MNSETKELIKLRIKKAEDALKDAGILVGAGSYFGAVNRIYYSAFYAARALLAVKGLDSPKHSGVIALFNQYFVKENIVSKEIGKILKDLFEMRSEGDYEDNKTFTKSEVDEFLIKVQTFMCEIKNKTDKLCRN